MRSGNHNNQFSVHAIAGTYVITLGFDARKDASKSLLGFAIHRSEFDENNKVIEAYWLKGYKPFKDVVPNPRPGVRYSTYEHPVQSFIWGDFTVKPGRTYEYKIVPVSGQPKKLEYADPLIVRITTEPLEHHLHEIHFNRAAAASQAYAEKFDNKKPTDNSLSPVEKEKRYEWLSRGLYEAVCNFIRQAKGPEFALYAALYELDYVPALKEFKKVLDAGADVKIIYESREGKTQTMQNENALREAGFNINDKKVTFARKNTDGIPHNKFMILLRNNKPLMVWTGSTNLSEGGIFGHANVGHCVKDASVAAEYLKYWQMLKDDPEKQTLVKKVSSEWPDITEKDIDKNNISVVFSPRRGYNMLNLYAGLFGKTSRMANITLPFNLDKRFITRIEEKSPAIRYILLNSGKKNFDIAAKYNPDPDVVIAPGSKIDKLWHQWLNEIHTGLNGANVLYIHTKFLLVDPLGKKPLLITGSANFSEPSTNKNDENMLIIACSNKKGETRVQDIYLGEFFRLFDHLYFRYLQNIDNSSTQEQQKRRYLKSDPVEWVSGYYNPATDKYKRRNIFSYGFD
jgi:phosphatidylserine/phosphatidylglycerophosphate/cardiolipin synthase-like enzyme